MSCNNTALPNFWYGYKPKQPSLPTRGGARCNRANAIVIMGIAVLRGASVAALVPWGTRIKQGEDGACVRLDGSHRTRWDRRWGCGAAWPDIFHIFNSTTTTYNPTPNPPPPPSPKLLLGSRERMLKCVYTFRPLESVMLYSCVFHYMMKFTMCSYMFWTPRGALTLGCGLNVT